MKNVFFYISLALILSACSNSVKFPISDVTPAAEIQAKLKQDKNNNYEISVTADNMASPERLSPARKTYVVWIETQNGDTNNVGQLEIKNSKKATLNTVSPFKPTQIFITAEDEGNVTYPSGEEISRAKF